MATAVCLSKLISGLHVPAPLAERCNKLLQLEMKMLGRI